jgi:hypothetical protein
MKKENKVYPDFNIENDNDLEIKKLEIELKTRQELKRLELEKSRELARAELSLDADKEAKRLELEKSRELEREGHLGTSQNKGVEFTENPEVLNKKLKGSRPFQYIEEMDIQKRAGRIRKIINWWKKGRTKRVVMVNMELKNGNHRSFIVYTSENGFSYNKARYLFDNESSYYNVDFRFWCFDYHEDFVLPIKKTVPIKEIKDMIDMDYHEISHSVNPNTIENFIVSEIAKNIMSGASVWEFLRNARLIWVVELILGIVNFLLLLNLSGVFDKLKGG